MPEPRCYQLLKENVLWWSCRLWSQRGSMENRPTH